MAVWNPQANSLFLSARDVPPGPSREAYIDEACGEDSNLRAEVIALLKADDHAGTFLESGAMDLPADSDYKPAPIERPGDMVGSYKLLQEIGEGGMGLVFMAEQSEPVRRTVALKIIKPGMDTRQVVARFEAERQALALMDHPNIAKVFDGGMTDAGRPYFVMELVKGTAITNYCDEQRLSLSARMELFIPVCQAVQHAHQKGIIHRDLKPSNVMIARYDGLPVPKVIDFGVAKATGQKLNERTMFTEFGAVLGTPEYMSPEQAELNQLDIDTRSDVYSMGVILYELLTGTTPLGRNHLKTSALHDLLRMIREEEPPKPSTRISMTQQLATVAAQRGLEPKQLSSVVRGELDWIVMKALEKDRNRRYQTATDLLRDIERYLANEPVLAYPPSALYQVRKFAQRNRGPVFAGALVMASLVGGITASTLLTFRAMRAESAAIANADAADTAADAERRARESEAELRRKAEGLSSYLVNILNEMIPEVGHSHAAPTLIQSAERVKESFSDNPDIRASLARALARAYLNMRRYDAAAVELRQCLELTRDPQLIFDTQALLAHCLLRAGQVDEGTKLLRDLFQRKLGRVFGKDADELRAAWPAFQRIDLRQREIPGQDGLTLDGDADYVIVPDLQFDGQPPWTLEAIVWPAAIDEYVDHAGNRWTSLVSATDGGAIGLETNGGKWAIDLYTADGHNINWEANYSTAFAASQVRLKEWQHIAGVWDGSELRIFVDGKLEETKKGVDFCSELSKGPFFVGADPAGWNLDEVAQGYFHGRLRAVRISHGAEYADSFSSPDILNATPETLLLYDFTIDTGRYAIDRSGHGHHGIIIGAKFAERGE